MKQRIVSYVALLLMRFYAWTRPVKQYRFMRPLLALRSLALWGAFTLAPISGAADSTNAQIGAGTTLSYSTDASPVGYTAIPNIRSFGEIGSDRPETDSTDLDSEAIERIGGLPDGKEFTITAVANTVTEPLFEGFYDDGDNVHFKMTSPAPLSRSRYFDATPLGVNYGTVESSGLRVIISRWRISGAITS